MWLTQTNLEKRQLPSKRGQSFLDFGVFLMKKTFLLHFKKGQHPKKRMHFLCRL